ncbi:MAG TPA: hypothetical protein ENG87_05125 [Candidatus Pacearchaeota archaeon]|nr:hypothetical protein BMS3Abin17_01158 [archaeon BMS3Abin17]HDK42739.1 hypothetical protein [Candidatus Pacearchaeota archaeon]HDZ60964.1 hypothetical protein [Candidatus Pacearchaeota archaeon]
MKYVSSIEGNKKIQKDMKIIINELKKSIPGILSIILTGGFSRGEGPIKKIGKEFHPYNDYDIQIISSKDVDKDKIDEISTKISKKIGHKGILNFYPFKKEEQKIVDNFYIDLKCDTPKELKKLLPRIRTYELRNNSLVLWGKDLRKIIPNYELKKIPLSEGAKLLLDRMGQLIEYYSTKKIYDKEFLSYVIQQAYTACCTSLLLLVKKYDIGYLKSANKLKEIYQKEFPELYKKIPDLDDKILQYVKWRINPNKPLIKDIKKEWFIARKNLLEVSRYFFSKFLEKDIKNNEELSKAIFNMQKKFYNPYLKKIINLGGAENLLLPFVSLLLKYKYYKRLKKIKINKPSVFFTRSPDLVIFSSLIYLISSINEEGVDENILKKGQEILRRVYPSKSKNWENTSIDYANAYIAFFLQKI